MIDRKRILVLYWHPEPLAKMRVAILHHLQAMESSPANHKIIYYNTFNGAPAWLGYLNFDAVILHTTFLCLRWSHRFYPWKWQLRWIKDLRCLKIAIPQDEYDHSEILDEWLYEWGVSAIFTNFDQAHRKILYPIMQNQAEFYNCFTGYIDDAVARTYQPKLLPVAARSNDIVYRATHLPYWFGSQGQLKHQIADVVAERAGKHGLKCDISTRPEDIIVGNDWIDFVASGRAIIGCESGSSALDRRGEIKAKIQSLLAENPHLSFEEVGACMPTGWDDYRFFAISPRHFEAVVTKTCQILVEGHYDGVLEPDKHYIPLKRDFSNLDQVLEKVKDHPYIQDMVERAYEDIYLSGRYTHQKFAEKIEMVILKHRRQQQQNILHHLMWPVAQAAGHLSAKNYSN
jgi:hypothetical protein